MNSGSDEKLDRLLQEAYPAVEVSPDFTLRLWRRLMQRPVRPAWLLPVSAYAMAAAIGIVAGIWSWGELLQRQGSVSAAAILAREDRWDLFGNAPFDSVAGSFLQVTKKGELG